MATTFIEMASIIVSDTHLIDVTPDTYHFIYINHTHSLSLSHLSYIILYPHIFFNMYVFFVLFFIVKYQYIILPTHVLLLLSSNLGWVEFPCMNMYVD